MVIYLGISSYIGGQRGRQDEFGNMLRTSSVEIDQRMFPAEPAELTQDQYI